MNPRQPKWFRISTADGQIVISCNVCGGQRTATASCSMSDWERHIRAFRAAHAQCVRGVPTPPPVFPIMVVKYGVPF